MENHFCPKCGMENVTRAAWCERCLHFFSQPAEDKSLSCPECFHVNSYRDDHCEVCHEPLKPGQAE